MSGNDVPYPARISSTPSADGKQQGFWRAFQVQQRQLRLRLAAEQAQQLPTDQVQSHLNSYLTLIANSRPFTELHSAVVDLIAALHPWPLRWQKWVQWQSELHFAIDYCRANQLPVRQALFSAELAGLLLAWGQYHEAIAMAKQAITLAEQYDLLVPLALGAFHLVEALNSMGQSQQAEEWLAQMEEKADRLAVANSAEQVQADTYFAWHKMKFLRRHGELARAIELGNRTVNALNASIRIDNHQLAEAYVQRSTILWANAQYDLALADLDQAISLFTEVGDLLAAEIARGNMGLVYYSMGRLGDAERITRKTILQMEEANANWELIRVLGNLVAIHMARGDLSSASYYLARQMDMVNRFDDTNQMMLARSNQATLHLCQGHYAQALAALQPIRSFYHDQGYKDVETINLLEISSCYYGLGQIDKAIEFARQAEAICETTDLDPLRIFVLRHLATLPVEEPRWPLAINALALADEYSRPVEKAACLFTLAQLTGSKDERDAYWHRGRALMQEIGALDWLKGCSPENLPFIPYML